MLLALLLLPALQQPYETASLDERFLSEGATAQDVDGDGSLDVVSGPFWWAGPSFEERFRFRNTEAFDPNGYSQQFLNWGEDVDADGDEDIVLAGFPGQEALWYENPGSPREVDAWRRHLIHPGVGNESPAFADLDGDGRRDLVFHSEGVLGWCSIPTEESTQPWPFHIIDAGTGLHHFTHGLGVGDLSGDGRADVVLNHGWWEQPAELGGPWTFHEQRLSKAYGGAQILVHDWDGDGDNDVVTSLAAHQWGLSWFENSGVGKGGPLHLVERPIMGAPGDALAGGFAVSELHALAVCDLDGDGRLDFVTGKRFKSHGYNEPGSRDAAWIFGLRNTGDPEQLFEVWPIHADSGVGTQVCAADLNGDGHADFVTGSKRGVFVHVRAPEVPAPRPPVVAAGPDERFPEGGVVPRSPNGRALNFDFETGDLTDWTAEGSAFAGNAFEGQPIEGDTVRARRGDMISAHAGSFWIGGYERLLDEATGTLTSEPFLAEQRWLAFLIAGGSSRATRLEVLHQGRVVLEGTGRDQEELRPSVLDLEPWVGEELRLRLVDESSGGWGHLNFDHARLYAERPRFPDGLEVVCQRDVIANQGLLPEEAARAMTVPEGFAVDLVAAEPDLHQPIALTVDDRGRLWVAEAHSYPVKRGEGAGTDRILILEDVDEDGSFETQTVFAEGLDLVSGLAVGFGGVFVGQAPELLFIPDIDGDDRPDGPPEVLLDGWGYQDTHETLNAFTWGPDGWLYGCHGVFTYSNVGAPGTPDEERVSIDAGVWRYHPTDRAFEVFAEGTSNPWGVDFDSRGEAFVSACVIPHFYHLVPGARYQRQAGSHDDPYTFADLPTIADHRHFVGDWPHSGNGRSDSAGGGHAHCGLLVYQGGAFPAEYRDSALFFNVHGNRMNRDLLVPDGATYVASHGEDLLRANDAWFRGISARTGPHGEVFFIDWYDQQACHLNDAARWDRSNGRLYRLRYGDLATAAVDLPAMDEAGLVGLALGDDVWAGRRARRLLQERGLSEDSARALDARLAASASATQRLHALWTLGACRSIAPERLLEVLAEDEDPTVRGWAARFLGEVGTSDLVGTLAARAEVEQEPVVLRQLASAAQRFEVDARWPLLRALAHSEPAMAERTTELVTWYGLEDCVGLDPVQGLALVRGCASDSLQEFAVRRAAATDASLPALVAHLGALADRAEQLRTLDALQEALGDRRGVEAPEGWGAIYGRFLALGDVELDQRLTPIAARFGDVRAFPALRTWLAEDGERRDLAFEVLVAAKDLGTREALVAWLGDPATRVRALRALGTWPDEVTTSAILGTWASFSPEEQREAVAVLTSYSGGALAVLEGIGAGGLGAPSLIAPTDARRIQEMSADHARALDAVWGSLRPVTGDKLAQLAGWKERLTDERLAAADRNHGRAVYAKTCQRCHQLFDAGAAVGPGLTGSNRADLDYLLRNLIDPSAEIPADYRAEIVATVDGRILTGVIARETSELLVLSTETGPLELDKADVEARRTDPNSLMPEGQLDALTEEEAVDLVAYLGSDSQVARRLLPGEEGEFFDGTTLTGWTGDPGLWSVEDGVIVGRTGGLSRNAFLVSDFDLADFRLVVDVKLEPDTENSGIQFRSTPLPDGDIKGYQADIGAGWWGKLYDEHGRGILVGEVEDRHRPGEWNTYEILAVGSHVQLALNGHRTVHYVDSEERRGGRIAPQLHSGGAMEISFRIRSLELDPGDPGLTTTSSER